MKATAIARRDRCCSAAAWAAAADDGPRGVGIGGAGAGKVLRYAFDVAETGFDPAQISDLYSRICNAHIFEALYRFDYLARPPSKVRPHTARRPCPRSPTTSGPRRPHPARHLLRRRPGVQGQAARAGRGGLRLRLEALLRPGASAPNLHRFEEQACSGSTSCAQARDPRQDAVRLRPRGRGPARARPLHACRSGSPSRVRASSTRSRLPHLRRGGARGGRGLRRRHRRASRRHRSVPAGALAAQLADRASSATRTFARSASTASRPPTTPSARRCSRSSRAARLPMVDRVEVSIIEESQPRWLALPQRRDRRADVGAARVRRPGDARTASSRRGSRKRGVQMDRLRQRRPDALLLQHGGSDGRRLHAGEGGAAPRDRAGHRRRRRDRAGPARPGDPGAIADRAGGCGLRPELPQRERATTTRRAPRRCSTCTATSTATATAGASCPTASRW